jgi:hypothetical protein
VAGPGSTEGSEVALVKCVECGNEVSNRAASCPKCANPIASAPDIRATETSLTTTQVTAKKFKGQQRLAVGLGALGLIFIVADSSYAIWGALLFLVGLVWYFDDCDEI